MEKLPQTAATTPKSLDKVMNHNQEKLKKKPALGVGPMKTQMGKSVTLNKLVKKFSQLNILKMAKRNGSRKKNQEKG